MSKALLPASGRLSLGMIFISIAAFVLSGCSTVATHTGKIDSTRKPGVTPGLVYCLPKGLIRLRGVKTDAGYEFTANEIYVADPSATYYLKPHFNAFFEDDTTISVNSKGLLSSVNVESEDKTAEIVGDIAFIAAKSIVAGRGVAPDELPPFDFTFEPKDWEHYARVLRYKFGFELKLTANEAVGIRWDGYQFSSTGKNAVCPAMGVVFRPAISYTLTISDKLAEEEKNEESILQASKNVAAAMAILNQAKNDQRELEKLMVSSSATPEALEKARTDFETLEAKIKADEKELTTNQKNLKKLSAIKSEPSIVFTKALMLPDINSRLLFPMARTAFMKRTDAIEFTDGMLTKVQAKRPSIVLGFLQLPKKILEGASPLGGN